MDAARQTLQAVHQSVQADYCLPGLLASLPEFAVELIEPCQCFRSQARQASPRQNRLKRTRPARSKLLHRRHGIERASPQIHGIRAERADE